MKFEVKHYRNIIDLLNAYLSYKKKMNSMYSLRAWTKSLGYKHPSFLSQCLRRERNLNAQFIKRLFEREKFTKEDKQYISFLYLLHCAQDINDLELDHLFRYHDIDMPISVLL